MKYLGDLLLVSIPAAVTGSFALLAIVVQGRRTRREVEKRVGTPNGQGNVVQMLERALQHQGRQDERMQNVLTRLGRIEAGQKKQDERLEALEGESA